MTRFRRLATTLHALLGPQAEAIADQHALIRRRRKFSASSLLATFALGYWQNPQARADDLVQTAAQLGVHVSPQAIDQRFGPALRDALRDLLRHALQTALDTNPRAWPLLRAFTTVQLADSTTIPLTPALADQYPGGGGAPGEAAVKVHVQWDLASGRLVAELGAARHSDNGSGILDDPLPAGSLVLRDLGYFDLDRFAAFNAAGISWLSRAKANLVVFIDGQRHKLVDWLATQPGDLIDRPVELCDQRMPCRLVARRVPAEVARRRQAAARRKARKKYGYGPNGRLLRACEWTMYVTNLAATFDATALHTVYRVRWQIELLFKLWKSHAHLAAHRSDDPTRQLIELFARLLGVVLQHWVLVTTGWQHGRLSLVKAARVIRAFVPVVLSVWRRPRAIAAALDRLTERIGRCRLTTRKKCPGTHQTLEIEQKRLT